MAYANYHAEHDALGRLTIRAPSQDGHGAILATSSQIYSPPEQLEAMAAIKQQLDAWQAQSDGFHMVEHLLLRPRPADKAQWKKATRALSQAAVLLAHPVRNDPYSAQVSFVFPDWNEGFRDKDFREFVQQTLREETPAHLSIHLNWLDMEAMRAFEAAYDDWLESLRAPWQWIHPT